MLLHATATVYYYFLLLLSTSSTAIITTTTASILLLPLLPPLFLLPYCIYKTTTIYLPTVQHCTTHYRTLTLSSNERSINSTPMALAKHLPQHLFPPFLSLPLFPSPSPPSHPSCRETETSTPQKTHGYTTASRHHSTIRELPLPLTHVAGPKPRPLHLPALALGRSPASDPYLLIPRADRSSTSLPHHGILYMQYGTYSTVQTHVSVRPQMCVERGEKAPPCCRP